MRKRTPLGLAAVSLAAVAIGAFAPAATADTAAQGNDAVVVGSDTVQFGADFVADGDFNGNLGYNSGTFNRVFDYFATGDANGRFTNAGGVSGSSPATPGAETIVLRAGTKPVVRPNGSGAGIGALLSDVNGGYRGLPTYSINAARASRLPTSSVSSGTSEDAACDAVTNCGGYHVYEVANDTLAMAQLATGSNAVNLDATQLWNVYNCTSGYQFWDDANIGGTSHTRIVPEIPQSGSGTRTFFLATIDAASGHGTTDPTLSGCATTVEEHDPSGITQDPHPADAIEPFSVGRLNMINSFGYFQNSGSAAGTPATGYTQNALAIQSGNSLHDAGQPVFSTKRAVYIVVRQHDLGLACNAGTTPTCFVPGGTKNIVNSLIAGGATSVFRSGGFSANWASAGFTQKFQDCGVDPDSTASSTNVCVTTP